MCELDPDYCVACITVVVDCVATDWSGTVNVWDTEDIALSLKKEKETFIYNGAFINYAFD